MAALPRDKANIGEPYDHDHAHACLHSVTPNEHGIPYSIPTIITPDGEYIMDSRAITEYVESQRAQPSLHLDNNIVEEVEFLWASYMGAIKPIFLNQVPKRILPDESLEYWYATRKEMAGMPVEELEEKKGGESAWDEAEMALREVSALLKKNKKGPFFLGDVVSYADLIWGSVLLFSERIGPDFFGEALKRSGDGQSHLDLLNAIRPWSV
ncbi:hypothetical protein VI817_005688 [Penicillium citrinum]|nr:hypothetical protein VI817_005688 [Penicillium citrinum]